MAIAASLIGGAATIPSTARQEQAVEPQRCEWLAGDLHIHTTYSHDSYGGPTDDNTGPEEAYTAGHAPESQFAVAKSRGLDYLAITDHNDIRSQGHFSDEPIASSGVISIGGYENSLDGHAQMLGAHKLYDEALDPSFDSSAAGVNAAADALRTDGGAFQINHPSEDQVEADHMNWSYGFEVEPDTIEVWNISRLYQPPFPSASSNDDAIDYWEKWLDRGAKIGATGGSDNHYVATTAAQGAGQPTTWVCAGTRSEAGVLGGLRAGRTFISHQPPNHGGPEIYLEAEADRDDDNDYESMVGSTVPANTPLRVRVVGAPGTVLRITKTTGAVLAEVPVTSPLFEHRFTAGQSDTWVRAEVLQQDGQAQRKAACDGTVGSETTYCRNQLLVLGMTSAIYLDPAPVGNPLPNGQFLVGADKTSLAPEPERYQPNGDPRTEETQDPAVWEKDPVACNAVPTDDGGDPTMPDPAYLDKEHHFIWPDSQLGWPDHNPNCIYLGGYGLGPLRGAEGVDEAGVWVRSVAISNGARTVVFQVFDTVGFFHRYRTDVCDRCGLLDIREEIARREGLGSSEYVTIASTHTHGGADTYGGWGGVPKWYWHQMRDAAIDSAHEAIAALEPARISVGQVQAPQFNNERRDNYYSTPDFGAVWMSAESAEGEPLATLLNYAAHPVETDWDNKNLHADWPGRFNAGLEAEMPGSVSMVIEGGLGNVSPNGGLENMGPVFARFIKHDIDGGGDELTSNYIEAQAKVISHPVTNGPEFALGAIGGFDREFLPGTQGADGPGTYSWSKQGNPARGCNTAGAVQLRTPVAGYRIGELNVFTGPGELFSNMTEVVKSSARTGLQTMVFGNANDSLGYIIQSFEYDRLGGVATDNTVGEYEETFALDPCFGDHVLDEMLKINASLQTVNAGPARPSDRDRDGVPNFRDNCQNIFNPDQQDTDGDGVGDACDDSTDPTTSPSPTMTASESPSPTSTPSGSASPSDSPSESPSPSDSPSESPSTSESASGSPSPSDPPPPLDGDRDGIPDDVDNCPNTANTGQANTDGDSFGDACEPDFDDDGVADDTDNCRTVDNPGQADSDTDETGDACEGDTDGDGVIDDDDNCINQANPSQENTYGDERGDACEPAPNPGGGGGGSGDGQSPSPTPTPTPTQNSGAAEETGEIQTTISADSSLIRFGNSVTLSGMVSAPRACGGSFSVDLSRREFGSDTFEAIATLEVGEDLVWTYTGLPEANASYMATARDTGSCEGRSSSPVDVLVKVKIAAAAPARCVRDATVRGSVAPSRPGTTVALQRRSAGKWRKVDADKLNNDSRFRLETDKCRGHFRIVWKGPDIRNERSAFNFRMTR